MTVFLDLIPHAGESNKFIKRSLFLPGVLELRWFSEKVKAIFYKNGQIFNTTGVFLEMFKNKNKRGKLKQKRLNAGLRVPKFRHEF